MGSVTTGGTLSTIYTLRSYNLKAAGLGKVWVLLLIGGQASLFLVETELEPVVSDIDVRYLDTNGNTEFAGGDYTAVLEPLDALLSSSLMASTWSRNNSLDLWGNMKISHILHAGAMNSSGWIPVIKGPKYTTLYTSLLGVPIIISSNYPPAFAQDQRTLLVQSRITDESTPAISYARAHCPLSTVYITASVSCTEGICNVVAIQPSKQPHPPSALIPFRLHSHFGRVRWKPKLQPRPSQKIGRLYCPPQSSFTFKTPISIESGRLLKGTSNLTSVPIADFSLRL